MHDYLVNLFLEILGKQKWKIVTGNFGKHCEKTEIFCRLGVFHLPLFYAFSLLLRPLGVFLYGLYTNWPQVPVRFGQSKALAGDQKIGGNEMGDLLLLDPSPQGCDAPARALHQVHSSIRKSSPSSQIGEVLCPNPPFSHGPRWCASPLGWPQQAKHP